MNKVYLMGNLGQDPEVRSTQGGQSVCSFSIATSSRIKVGDEWQDKTEWHKVVAWGKTAETIGRHMKKGSKILVEGRLQTRKWQNKEGHDQYTTEIVVDTFEFAGAKPNGADEGKPKSQAAPADDEIPY